jgi:hypothetical protein
LAASTVVVSVVGRRGPVAGDIAGAGLVAGRLALAAVGGGVAGADAVTVVSSDVTGGGDWRGPKL